MATCFYSHTGPHDPIVHPGHAGASHSHDFYGPVELDESNTPEAMLDQATICDKAADTAAYWRPPLSNDAWCNGAVAEPPIDPRPGEPGDPPGIARRRFLTAGGAALTALVVAACSEADRNPSPPAGDGGARPGVTDGEAGDLTADDLPAPGATLTAADFEALSTCGLTRAQTAGPFDLDERFDRRDVTEGRAGHPLRLGFRVVDDACRPVPGAAVEI
ncbi:hypothetical protein BH23ACT2_BH23ACT2_06850 [soil metagenome]